MFEMLMGNHPIIVPSENDEGLRFSSNFSSNAMLILQRVNINFFNFYFNYAQVVVVVGFMTLYTNNKTWYTVSHTGM